ncbi:MAG: type VI secretion system ImpA family N-terminal domain-containing protein, partial [Planctomycetota bacterium]|nr:type VI secretion system ImpA family N-terminal domain-containing protein [Planctomycetota bacterium]
MFTNDYIDGLLAAVSEDAPSGENIEYDPDFLALEAMLPETTEAIFDGAQTESTDWRGIMGAAEALLARSKHLPTAVILTAGLIEVRGFLGLRDGLCLIANMLDRYWDSLWPPLDPDDPEPLERESALTSLSPPLGAY